VPGILVPACHRLYPTGMQSVLTTAFLMTVPPLASQPTNH
jgi:hypothetical protein